MTEQREVYRVNDFKSTNSINRILARIAERLDKMEGLKGNPKFYTEKFEFQQSITGVLAADTTGLLAEFGPDGDAVAIDAAGAVMEYDYDANTILASTTDDTPAALTIAEQTVVGRITGGNIDALTTLELMEVIEYIYSSALIAIRDESDVIIHQYPIIEHKLLADTHGYGHGDWSYESEYDDGDIFYMHATRTV